MYIDDRQKSSFNCTKYKFLILNNQNLLHPLIQINNNFLNLTTK